MAPRFLTALLAVGLLLPLGCGGGTPDADGFSRRSGSLSSSDQTLQSGEYTDEYTFSADSGQWIEVAMNSSEFDPYVILRPPSCADATGACDRQIDNDDFTANRGAFLWHQADESGRWAVIATSASVGESGAYDIAYRVVDAGETAATPGVTLAAARTERGRLESGDIQLNSGEFVDNFGFVGKAGDAVTIDFRSSEFDPYLILQMPNDQQEENDDWQGAQDHARLELTLPTDGMYQILATTYQAGEAGGYELQIAPAGTSPSPAGGDAATSTDGEPFSK